LTAYLFACPKRGSNTKVWRRLYNRAHGAKIFNNVFLESGEPTSITKGWYSLGKELKDVEADYNYVAKRDFLPVKANPLKQIVGSAAGWDDWSWYEPHGINGGDPGFTNLATKDFRLLATSILKDKATALPGVITDLLGVTRPQGLAPDIGPYEYR
jgi:hypothetical protein